MNFDLPRDMILQVDEITVRLDHSPHPFESENAQAIAENWLLEMAAKPALFNGTMALLSELSYRDGRLAGRCHAVSYATFLYWRNNRATPGVGHAFAHPMLVSRDNALIAIRMGAHTMNAGRVYFAAGSFETVDFPGGKVDMHFNMAREVLEETGLDIDAARRGKRHYALSMEQGTVIFRRYHLDQDADELAARIRQFVAGDPDPEIEGPVVIRSADDLPDGLMPHMKALIDWHFGG